jgi:hypothetical protein
MIRVRLFVVTFIPVNEFSTTQSKRTDRLLTEVMMYQVPPAGEHFVFGGKKYLINERTNWCSSTDIAAETCRQAVDLYLIDLKSASST